MVTQDRLGATARLYWQPSGTFSTDLFYYWSKTDEKGAGLTCFFQNPDSVFNTFTWPGFTAPKSYESRCRSSEAESKDHKVLINGPSTFEMTSQIVGLTLNWEYKHFEIKSITAWSHQNNIGIVNDSDATDIPGVETGPLAVRSGWKLHWHQDMAISRCPMMNNAINTARSYSLPVEPLIIGSHTQRGSLLPEKR